MSRSPATIPADQVTKITVSRETMRRLQELGIMGETYETVIGRLLDVWGRSNGTEARDARRAE